MHRLTGRGVVLDAAEYTELSMWGELRLRSELLHGMRWSSLYLTTTSACLRANYGHEGTAFRESCERAEQELPSGIAIMITLVLIVMLKV